MLNIFLKAKYSFITALVFFIVSNPETYKFSQMIFGTIVTVITPSGVTTPNGLLLQTFIFFLAMWALMLVPV